MDNNYTKEFIEQDSKEFTTIYKTKNYEMFKSIRSNRKLNPSNYSKLLKSMKEQQLVTPVLVNEKYEVIDGQHRLRVCEDLCLPVYYFMMIGYSVAEMKRANLVSANWTMDDFLNAYASESNPHYLAFAQMKERYGTNTTDLVKLISKIQGDGFETLCLKFNEGNLVMTDEEKQQVIDFLIALEDFSFFREYKNTKFFGAFLRLYYFSGYSHTQMQARLKTRGDVLTRQLSTDDYVKILANKIYSFGQTKANIYYDAERQRMYTLD